MLNEKTRARIEEMVASDRVVLFMKGTPQMPQCGFSATTTGILDSLLPAYTTFNVLEDQEVRDGIKAWSSWPTIPQLYIDGEFVGGCDIVKQMYNAGDLHEALGQEPPDGSPPDITLSDRAAELIRQTIEGHPGNHVHLKIDSRWQHSFNLGPAEGHEIRSFANGVELLMDLGTAQRAPGLELDIEETFQGYAFRVSNPNEPPPVRELDPDELKGCLAAPEEFLLFDVRPAAERERARIAGDRVLDDDAIAFIRGLPKETGVAFYCHRGARSQSVAEHFRLEGHTRVYNLSGGINAWSEQVDPDVPRY